MQAFVILLLLLIILTFLLLLLFVRQQRLKSIEVMNRMLLYQSPVVTHNVIDQRHRVLAKERHETDAKPPEVTRLEALLKEFESDNTRWDALIGIADIYKAGAYPRFVPNIDVAAKIYKIVARCPNGEYAGIAQNKYVEARVDRMDNSDIMGHHLPIAYGLRTCNLAERTIQNLPFNIFEKPRNVNVKIISKQPDDVMLEMIGQPIDIAEVEVSVSKPPAYFNDNQNVHDHSVTRITEHNINVLRGDVNYNTMEEEKESYLETIRSAILEATDVEADIKADALDVLDSLTMTKHSKYELSEVDALGLVWNKLNESRNKINLIGTLTKQLASGMEHGHVVCSTGKIARLMGTLDGEEIGNMQTVKPIWAVRDEINGLAAKTRDDYEARYGEIHDSMKDEMKNSFAESARNTYITTLGMSKDIIEPIIEQTQVGFD